MKLTEESVFFLVVDDDELSRDLMTVLLSAEGHEVEVAASGEEAVTRLTQAGLSMPDVILSDMQMPGLSGETLGRGMRSAAGEVTRLIAMSASQPDEASLSKFDGFLLKPFSIEDLDAAVTRTMPRGEVLASAAPSKPSPELSALNEDIYTKLLQMVPGAQLAEMYAMCLTDARKRLVQMGELAAAGDDDGYRKAAHTIKGGCGMIGATELHQLAETAERDGLGPDSGMNAGTSGVTTLLERFSRACDRLERILGERK